MREGMPVLLDVRDRLCVVVGGGAVGRRKAVQFAEEGAKVHVISPDPGDAGHLPAGVAHVAARFEPGQLDGAFLAVAATDKAGVNDAVVAAARARGVLAARADAGPADVRALAFADVDGVTLAASAGGAALSVALRDALAAGLDPRWGVLARVMRDVRADAVATRTPAARRRLFRRLASPEALSAATGGEAAVRAWLDKGSK